MAKPKPTKPQKPYPDFPLFPHATGRWAKKIRGRLVYFGKWAEDPMVCLQRFKDQEEDLRAGRVPRARQAGTTVAELCNRFLTARQARVNTGELRPITFRGYFVACERLVKFFGRHRLVADLGPEDFEALRGKLSETMGLNSLAHEIPRLRIPFSWGVKAGLIQAPRYGDSFNRPPKRVLLQLRYDRGPRLFSAAEIRTILDRAKPIMRAMVLLGINCAFGPSDIGRLPQAALDLEAGWVTFPRPKTAIVRRCPLWRQTIDALREAVGQRPPPKKPEYGGLVFLTRTGRSWTSDKDWTMVPATFGKLLDGLGLRQEGRGFYTLRHVFRTVADETLDMPAIDLIMGHVDSSMASVYRQRIDDARLLAVVNYVRTWLFAEGQTE